MIDVAWEHAAGDSTFPKKFKFFVICLDVDGVFGVIIAAVESNNVFLPPPCREIDGDFINHE